MKSFLRAAGAALALAAGVLAPGGALATQPSYEPPTHCSHRALQPEDTRVPANLPAIVIDEREQSPDRASTIEITAVRGGALTLGTLGRAPDPRDPKSTLLVPAKSDLLEVGATYEIDYTVRCSYAPNPSHLTGSFTTTSAVPLPTHIGSAEQFADATVMITPSAELQAFLATTRFEAFVDGVSVGTTAYGVASGREISVVLRDRGIYMGNGYVGGGDADGIGGALCKTGTARTEQHDIELHAHVAGAGTDPEPVKLSAEIDCSEALTRATHTSVPDSAGGARGPAAVAVHSGCAAHGRAHVGGATGLPGLSGLAGIAAGLAWLVRRRR